VNNLVISYDLDRPGQNYAKIDTAIKALAPNGWAKLNLSVWYVHTVYSMSQVYEKLKAVIDGNDRLVVVQANNAQAYNPLCNWNFVIDHWNAAA
jgi:hypothetical protein